MNYGPTVQLYLQETHWQQLNWNLALAMEARARVRGTALLGNQLQKQCHHVMTILMISGWWRGSRIPDSPLGYVDSEL